ncbi:hypothetical protein MJO28_005932 [Puccinia striiformis f. sp. tritici]|uniref:Uncharacterized protein n=1 Tax=Puccinia striiformis f. sp. tritici TaxID=168172 RepID=A0ACC0EGE6_9BASI|nr:hypothetical protein Pst134EA_011143 [Puccinia striiformis f. sp. tritici]KAH9467501.1 hypothetical protein Pst134EA_011143 [Puccinia striiformis f. sp. tritici]KAI7953385.1 hypothetical protein MJO28_005932 [Puccinia striiformis f. sp. tritici]
MLPRFLSGLEVMDSSDQDQNRLGEMPIKSAVRVDQEMVTGADAEVVEVVDRGGTPLLAWRSSDDHLGD